MKISSKHLYADNYIRTSMSESTRIAPSLLKFNLDPLTTPRVFGFAAAYTHHSC